MPSRALLGKNPQTVTTCGKWPARRVYGEREFLRGRGEVRQAAALCEDSAIRKRNLNTLDAEIDAFNDLIAVQCIGS
ncbi:MAG: hypothetical protein E6G76_15910 [Alphaproteobacteria bacterium]|nr:MAG: hypothetical protein E6G76_15910 [Alphaproteobacteria bacterium]